MKILLFSLFFIIVGSILVITFTGLIFVIPNFSSSIYELIPLTRGIFSSNVLENGEFYNSFQAIDLNINKTEIKDGFKLNYEDIECSITLSRTSDITYNPYLNGVEWTNSFNVPEKQTLGEADLDFIEFYNVTCNQGFARIEEKLIISKVNQYDFEINFVTLTREYSKAIINESFDIIGYDIKPQAYNLTFDTKTKNQAIINVELKEEYKLTLDDSKKIILSDKIVLDPTYIITNVSENAILDDVVCEGGGYYCHSEVNATNLVLFMPFDVLNKSPSVYDWSSGNHDGTLTGSAINHTIGGLNGTGAYQFYGTPSANYISIPYHADFNSTNITFTAWIYPQTKGDNQYSAIITKGSSGLNDWWFGLNEGDQLIVYPNTDADPACSGADGDITVNAWNFVAFTYNTSTFKLYVNGVRSGTDCVQPLVHMRNTDIWIGESDAWSGFDNSFNGTIDDVMFFDTNLSDTHISNIYGLNYSRFIANGNHTVNQTIASGNDRINITIQHSNQLYSNLSLRIYDETSWTAYQNMTDNVNSTFTIDSGATILNLSFMYLTDSYDFFSPILQENISMHTWSAVAVDNEYPLFSNYWDDNASLVDSGMAHFNVTITSTNGTAILEFDGTNYTASNATATAFNISVSVSTAGTFTYYWASWGNGTSNNYNTTIGDGAGLRYYKINSSEFPLFSSFTEFPTNNSEYYDGNYILNSTINSTNGTAGIEFNGVNYSLSNNSAASPEVFNKTFANLGQGTYAYYYWAFGNGSEEHYNTTAMRSYVITRNTTANQNVTPLLNSGVSNLEVIYPQQINASYAGTNYTAFGIKINGTSINYGQNYTWGGGGWVVNYSAVENQNYSSYTAYLNMTINKTASNITVYLNHTQQNVTISQGDSVWLNATLITGDNGTISLYNNGTLINTNETDKVSNLTTFSTTGAYNITAYYAGTNNYTANWSSVWWVNVTLPLDAEYPLFSNFQEVPPNGSAYSSGVTYRFNTTLISTNGTVGIEFNGVNYTSSNNSLVNIFNSSVVNLAAGDYPYYWFAWGNGTNRNYNTTELRYYTISKETGVIYAYANETRANFNTDNRTKIIWLNASLQTGIGNIQLWFNGTLMANTTTPATNLSNQTSDLNGVDLWIGTYNMSAVYLGNQNYTYADETWIISISEYVEIVISRTGRLYMIPDVLKMPYIQLNNSIDFTQI